MGNKMIENVHEDTWFIVVNEWNCVICLPEVLFLIITLLYCLQGQFLNIVLFLQQSVCV